jgi:hypothetical protein
MRRQFPCDSSQFRKTAAPPTVGGVGAVPLQL